MPLHQTHCQLQLSTLLKRECETVVYNLTLLHACHCVYLLCDVTLFLLIFKFVHVAMHSLVYCAWNNNYVDETQHYWQQVRGVY